MLEARSNAEAHLYMDLHPCPCGETNFDRSSTLVEHHGDLISIYEGRCKGCEAMRRFEIKMPDELPPFGDGVVYGGPEPSMIIDPGQFLWVSDQHARRAPKSLSGLDDRDKRAARRNMQIAIAALEEVLKFIPDGDDRVPAAAFHSALGRKIYNQEPGRPTRARLEAVIGAYRDVLDGYAAQ